MTTISGQAIIHITKPQAINQIYRLMRPIEKLKLGNCWFQTPLIFSVAPHFPRYEECYGDSWAGLWSVEDVS